MKKIKFALPLFILFLCMLATTVSAASGTCGESAVWEYNAESKTLYISGEGVIDLDFAEEHGYQSWTDYEYKIENVVINEGITEISYNTFSSHEKLKNISLPKSLLKIRSSVFSYCESLKNITIPVNVNSISSDAFAWCYNLRNIDVDSNNKYYTSIDGILYNDTVTSLISYPCGKEGSTYTLPGSVTSIESHAFCNNQYLEAITLHDNLEWIGYEAFVCMSSLKKLNIPKSTWYIADGVYSCNNLTEINVDPENSAYTSEDGVLFDKEKTKLICYPSGKRNTEYTVPKTVESIMEYAFAYSKLESIDLPENLKIIGWEAFSICENLSSVYFFGDLPYADYPNYYDSKEDIPLLCLEDTFYVIDNEVNVYYLPDKKGWDTLDKTYLKEYGINLLPFEILETDFLENIKPYLPYVVIAFAGIAVIAFVVLMLSKKSNKTIKHTENRRISNQTEVIYSNNPRNMASTQNTSQKKMIIKCPECGFSCEQGSLFCGNCGNKLSDK